MIIKNFHSELKKALLLCIMLFSVATLKAQLTGTKTIPGDYASIAAFITDVNTQGVGAGGVIVNISAGYTETAPSLGFQLTATGTAANPIIIQKSGVGANPLITSYTGGTGTPGSAVQDGIFALIGSDYVTIDGIDLIENASNTTNPSTMEYGYGLFKANATNGCQNNVIKNCVVTLSNINNATGTAPAFDGSRGINVVNSLVTTQTTAITVTAASGSNSNNSFTGNTVKNVNIGIALSGFAATAGVGPTPTAATFFGDLNNIIGGSLANANTIQNFGGAAAATNPAAGIRTVNQWSPIISYNTINNNIGSGGGVNHVSTLRGILIGAATSANTDITNNTITLVSGATTSQLDGISNAAGSTALSNTVNLNSNTIRLAYPTATSATINGITTSSTATTVNMNNNTFTNIGDPTPTNNLLGGTGTIIFLANTATLTNLNITGNTVTSMGRSSASTGTWRGISMASPTNGIISNNLIESLAYVTPTSTGSIDGIYGLSSSVNVTISNNIIRNLSTPTTGTINGIREFGVAGNKIITGNQVYSFATTTGGAGGATFNGIFVSTGTVTIQNNTIYNLVSTGSSGGTGGTVYGVQVSGSTSTSVLANKIYDLASNSTNPIIGGVLLSGGTTNTLTNNIIGDLRAANANATNAVIGINITGGTSALLYFNTVRLNASSTGVNFGTSALSASTTPNLTLNNNIFVNNSTSNGTGLSVAYRRSSTTLTSYQATSNRNDFFAPVIYNDGTTSYTTLATYQTAMATRDANSVSENPNFASTIGSNANFLHINTSLPTLLDNGASNITGITTDFDANIRQGNAGYVGSGTAPDIGADEFELTIVNCSAANGGTISPSTNNVCEGSTKTITSTGYSNEFGNSFQWKISTTAGGPYVNVSGGTGATTASYTTGTLTPGTYYYVMETTCSFGSLTGISNEYTLVVNPTPVVTITPSSATYCSPGTAVSLTASGATSYAWSPSTGLSAIIGATVNASPATTTTYSVIGQALGCPSLATTVVVTTATAPTITGVSATPSSVCNVGNSSLTSTVGFGPFTYCTSTHTSGCSGDDITNVTLGSINNSTTGCGGTSHQTYYAPSATTTTTLIAGGASNTLSISLGTDANQYCGAWIDYNQNGTFEASEFLGASANAGASGTTTIVFTVPAGTFNGTTRMRVIGGNDAALLATQACGASSSTWGETQDYDVTITGGVNPITLSWSPSTFLSSTSVANPTINGLNTTTSYTLSATANGCTTTSTTTVTANPLPSAPTATNSAQCGAQIPTASVTSTSGLPTPTFVWYDAAVGGTMLQTSTSTTFASIVSTTTTLYVAEKNMTTGCESALTPVTVTVATADNILASVNNATICIGQTVNLSVVNLNTTPLQSYAYTWSSTAGNGLSSTTGSSVSATPTTPGTYVYNVNGVDGGCNAVSSISVTVNPYVASITPINVTCFGANNGSFSLASESCGTASTYSVDGGAFGPIPTNLTPGSHNVIVKNTLGFDASLINFTITEPAQIVLANVTGSTVCQNATSAQITAGPSSGTVSAVFGTNVSITGSATSNYSVTPILPSGAIVTSTILRFSNVTTFGAEWPSDMQVSLTGGSTLASISMAAVNAVVTNAGPYDRPSSNYTSGAVNLQIVNTYTGTATLGNITLEIAYTVPSPVATNFYSAATGGTYLGTGLPFETVGTSVLLNTNTPGIYTFYAEGTNGTCVSASRVPVTITVNAAPSTNAGADQTVCSGTAVTLSGSGANTYSWNNSVTNGVAFTPAATTTYTLTGTAANGCTATDQVVVTVNASPTVNAGIDQTVCSGTAVTLSGSGANTYSWNNSVTNGVAFTPAATATYTVTGTAANGCTATDQAVVTVNSLPTVNAGADQTVCAGTAVTLSGSGANTYSWNNSVINATAFTPATTTTYTVTGTAANGCTATDQAVVTVNALPSVNAGTDQTVCSGTAVTLSGSGAATYSWNNSVTNATAFTPSATATYTVTGTDANGCQNTDQTVVTVNSLPTVNAGADQTVCAGTSVTLAGSGAATYSWNNSVVNATAFTPAATATYTVTGTDANGCQNTDQVDVTVNSLPTVNAGADQTVCAGTSVTLAGSGASTYSWNNSVVDATTFTPAATATYTVTGTDANGCQNTDQAVVTVNSLPTVNAGADQTVCAGTSVTLAGSGASTYSWNNSVIDATAFTPAATATYTVTGTDANGCQNTDQVDVTVNSLPSVNAGADQSVCAGTSVTLAGSGASTYSWDNGVTDAVAFTPAATVTYTVTGTDANGCENTDQVNVAVNSIPVATATDNGDATITAGAATNYQWIDCTTGLAIAGATSQTYTVTANGTYAVIESNGSCSDTSACVTIDYMKVSEMAVDAIGIYPNPTRDNVTVTMTNASASIEVIDAQGKLLKASQVVNGDKIDLSAYETGMYIFRVTTENGTSIFRVSKN